MDADDFIFEGYKYGESGVSLGDVQISGSIENTAKLSIIKKWNEIVKTNAPNKLLVLYDKMRFPEMKNITTLILASLIIVNNKIDKKEFNLIYIRYQQHIKNEKIRKEDIFRYARWLLSL